MGLEHRKAVEAIPPGLMHLDERLVLYVLATETNDGRLEWGHERTKLLAKLGLRDDQGGHKWLQRRLKALEDAGWIERKPQKRQNGGLWGWGLIRLSFRELGDSLSLDQHLDGFTPTPRAEDSRQPTAGFDRYPEHRNTYRDKCGKFTTGGQVDTDGVDKLIPTADGQVDTVPSDKLIPLHPDTPDRVPGQPRTIAPDGAEAAPNTDDSKPLEDRQRAQVELLKALERRWTMDGES